jgi:hypothetical protein
MRAISVVGAAFVFGSLGLNALGVGLAGLGSVGSSLGSWVAPAAMAQTKSPDSGKATEPPKAAPAVSATFKPDEVASIIRDAGYRAELVRGKSSWYINTGMAGRKVTIYLYCENDVCGSMTYDLSFTASSDFTLTWANQWNRDKRYAKAYIDTDGSLVVEYELSYKGGVTHDTIGESAKLFDNLVSMVDARINAQ